MLKRLKALRDKVRYINRLIIEIDKNQSTLQIQNTELTEKLVETGSCIDMLYQQMIGLEEKQEKLFSMLENERKAANSYVNPEYLLLQKEERIKYLCFKNCIMILSL